MTANVAVLASVGVKPLKTLAALVPLSHHAAIHSTSTCSSDSAVSGLNRKWMGKENQPDSSFELESMF